MQNNTLLVAMQQAPSPTVQQTRRGAGFGTKKISLRRSTFHTFPHDDRADIQRKLSVFRLAVLERESLANPADRAGYDVFLSNIKQDIEQSIMGSTAPKPRRRSFSRSNNNNFNDTLTMYVRFGVYGNARIVIHLTADDCASIEYDLSEVDLSFCDIPGAYQAVESITCEYVEHIESGSIRATQHRVLNAYPELQNRLHNILRDEFSHSDSFTTTTQLLNMKGGEA